MEYIKFKFQENPLGIAVILLFVLYALQNMGNPTAVDSNAIALGFVNGGTVHTAPSPASIIVADEMIEEPEEVVEEPQFLLTSSIEHDHVAEFLERWAYTAHQEHKRYGIPASIKLAQAIHETGWGRSSLARLGNNYFGMKYYPKEGVPYLIIPKGSKVLPGISVDQVYPLNDDDPDDLFQTNVTAWESWRDHSKLLVSPDHRYHILLEETPPSRPDYVESPEDKEMWRLAVQHWDDPFKRWAYGLSACGYATASSYARKLISIEQNFNLTQWDDYWAGENHPAL
jgi:flagellum-specific peptidoglycan hydrolase FlgJ